LKKNIERKKGKKKIKWERTDQRIDTQGAGKRFKRRRRAGKRQTWGRTSKKKSSRVFFKTLKKKIKGKEGIIFGSDRALGWGQGGGKKIGLKANNKIVHTKLYSMVGKTGNHKGGGKKRELEKKGFGKQQTR